MADWPFNYTTSMRHFAAAYFFPLFILFLDPNPPIYYWFKILPLLSTSNTWAVSKTSRWLGILYNYMEFPIHSVNRLCKFWENLEGKSHDISTNFAYDYILFRLHSLFDKVSEPVFSSLLSRQHFDNIEFPQILSKFFVFPIRKFERKNLKDCPQNLF